MVETGSAVMTTAVRCDRAAPSAVRKWLCELDDLGWVIGDLMMVASELVTNAVLQSAGAEGWIDVTVTRRDDRLVIAVADSAPREDPQQIGDLEAGDGLGRVLVEALTRRWGVERGRRHVVWAEI